MEPGYEVAAAPARHPTGPAGGEARSLVTIVLVTAAVVIAVVTRSWPAGAVAGGGAVACGRRVRLAIGVAFLVVAAGTRSAAAWDGLDADRLGPFAGWAVVVEEPRRFDGATRVLVEVDDERFEMWVRGRAGQLRVAGWRAGDAVQLAGDRSALEPVSSALPR